MQNDNQLVLKAKKGDNLAFQQLVMKYDRHVLNIAYSYRNNKDEADDIYQEVFFRVYKGLKNFQLRSKFSTWLYRITVNVCIEQKRKKKVREHESLDKFTDSESEGMVFSDSIDGGSKTDKSTLDNEINSLIRSEVDKLPRQLKMAFTLKYYHGYKIREISKLMNCTEGTIKSYLFTSSRKLKQNLQPVLEM
jgi:RNA polymerase sigma-70 factor (ECF subfamily)